MDGVEGVGMEEVPVVAPPLDVCGGVGVASVAVNSTRQITEQPDI